MLNLSPILLNFSEISLMYGMDNTHTHTVLLSLSFFVFLYLGFLLITESTNRSADWVVTNSHFNLLEKFYFVACSGPAILIINKG
jgi:hypothetical protein